MDNLDKRIIAKLAKNSQLSFRKISIEFGVSTDTIIRRYNRLIKNGGIKPTLDLDIIKLGYEVRVWYSISLLHGANINYIIEEIKKIKDIIRIVKNIGDYDLLIIAVVKNFNHMYNLGKKIYRIKGVEKIDGHPYLPLKKEERSDSAARGFFDINLLKQT